AHGQAAPTAALNAIRHFEEEMWEHIRERRCRARSCAGLIRYEIEPGAGEAGARAAEICPTAAIREQNGRYEIDDALCIRCGACREVAPEVVRVVDAIAPATVPAG
ncbi:MAG TPA: hypothetical protein VJ256_02590, partial [Dehalococcoidia bacterium]|nr:hypothetical protein [Dehalococcoidia bacterium]